MLTAVACGRSSSENADASGPVNVAVQVARLDTLRDVASAPGMVVPSTAGDWTIYINEPAEIAELPKGEGERVASGDLLVRFEIPSLAEDIATSELAMLDATGAVNRAKAAVAQTQSLFERGLIARVEQEARQNDLANAESRLRQATHQSESVKSDQTRSVVRARFAGTIAKVWHAAGDALTGSATDPILRVVDSSRVQVAVQLPILQLARIVPGQLATVRAIAGEMTELATITSKPDAAAPDMPTAEVRLAFTGPTTLPVDTPVSVEIVLDQRTDVVVVSASAIMTDDAGSYVVVAGEDQRAHRRDVRVGLRTRDLAHIVSGVTPGERVIVAGAGNVAEGTPIAVGR